MLLFSLYVLVESLSRVSLFLTPWTAACQASLSFTISQSLLKLMFILSIMPLNYLIIHCPLLLLPSIFPSIRVFSNDLALSIRWPKYWSFTFSISPSSEYSELISYRIHWFISSQSKGLSKVFSSTTIKKAPILQHPAYLMVQCSHLYMTTGKTYSFDCMDFIVYSWISIKVT